MKETKNGRSLYLLDELRVEEIKRVGEQLTKMVQQAPQETITLYIGSLGGNPDQSMGLYEYITSVLKPEFQTVALGEVASAAILIFMAGNYRVIGSYGCLYFHEITKYLENKHFTAEDLEREARNIKRVKSLYANIISKNSKCSQKVIKQMMTKGVAVSPMEAVGKGFAHEVLEKS